MFWLFIGGAALLGGAWFLSREGEFTTRRLASEVKLGAVPRTILFLGDSLTASGYWQNVKLENATISGKGWKGKPIGYIMTQARALIESVHPTEVVLLAGVNNVLGKQGVESIKRDLLTAWAQIHAAGAKVWAVKLTPWAGYSNSDERTRSTTLAINAFIDEQRGQPGGPDYVIDTSELGDAQGRLLKKYSWDKLHMIGRGYMKLAEIAQNALANVVPQTQVGDEPFPALRAVILKWIDKLADSNLAPDAYEFDYRTVTFVYRDVVKEATVAAADILPRSEVVMDGNIEKRIYFKTRTAGREPNVADTDVGADTPESAQRSIDALVDRLTRNDAAPYAVAYDSSDPGIGVITFSFLTPFREQRAAELLPGSIKTGRQVARVLTKVVDPGAEVGQVVGTAQETPWTCGPAALRAVMAHYGMQYEEGWLANFLVNIAVIGVRPAALVAGARKLGCHATMSYFKDVAALRPFLAHDVPVIVIVDSFLKPGQQGHYVVVNEVGPDTVTIMDPHVEGNKRVLSYADFEARWWNKSPGPDGLPRIMKHLAIVVVPGEEDEMEVGGEKPTHGRTAHVKGPPKGLVIFAKIAQAIAKGVVTFFTGGLGAQGYDALLDATHSNVSKMHAGEKAKWFNNASNPDMYIWALGLARSEARKYLLPSKDEDKKKFKVGKAMMTALGITPTSFDDIKTAMIPALKMHLLIYCKQGQPTTAHALQSIAILFYGGLDKVWPIVQAAYKGRPKFDWDKAETAPAVAGWVDAVVKAMAPYRTVPEGADNPDLEFAGEPEPAPAAPLVVWKPTSQRSGITARKIAALGKAQDSIDPREVLEAHFLAKSLGLENTAEALGQRHARLVTRRAEMARA